MTMDDASVRPGQDEIRIIPLTEAPGERSAWTRPSWVVYLWSIAELVVVTNPWQISSRLRVACLRGFGAAIGDHVTFRPRTRVRFPWNLKVGNNAWIGEGVWIHNQNLVDIGHDAVVSQDTFITTGSHAYRTDMALVTRSVVVGGGAWVTSRCILLAEPGLVFPHSSLQAPWSVVKYQPASCTASRSHPPYCDNVLRPIRRRTLRRAVNWRLEVVGLTVA